MVAHEYLDRLGRQLIDRPLAVRSTIYYHEGQRVILELDDDSTVELRLYWPRDAAAAALLSVRFDDHVGWILDARTTAGEEMRYYAWHATVPIPPTPPTPQHA